MEVIVKISSCCKKLLPLDAFSTLQSSSDGRHSHCKLCRNLKNRNKNFERVTEGTKKCGECEQNVGVNDFHANKSSGDGLQNLCKVCSKTRMKEYTSTLDGFLTKLFCSIRIGCKRRSKILEFDITLENIKYLYQKQKGKCAISNDKMTYITYDESKKGDLKIYPCNISVDRIDSLKSYTLDNIHLVCAIVNIMKTDLDQSEFINLCRNVAKYNNNLINE